jgi:hypothetical protein
MPKATVMGRPSAALEPAARVEGDKPAKLIGSLAQSGFFQLQTHHDKRQDCSAKVSDIASRAFPLDLGGVIRDMITLM